MCEPTTALIGLQIAGAAISAAGQVSQGNTAQMMGQLQQAAYEQQAKATENASAFEQMQLRRKQGLAAGEARAQIGASGVAFDGSPTEVLAAQAGQDELDIAAIQYGSKLKATQLRTQGRIALYGGERAQQAGYIAGASTLISGVGRAFSPNAVRMGGSPFAAGSGG